MNLGMEGIVEGDEAGLAVDIAESGGGTPVFLHFPLILKQILSNLPTSDLLTCALVCKAWNYESRCLLPDRRDIVAVIQGEDPCVKLKEFDTFLSTFGCSFIGLRLRVPENSQHPHCLGSKNVEEFYSRILRKLNLQYLRIDWRSHHEPSQPCMAILLLEKFVELGQLEQVVLRRLPHWLDFHHLIMKHPELTRLTTLSLQGLPEGLDEKNIRLG